jgi:hypothetical protein
MKLVTLERFAHSPYGVFSYLRTEEFQSFAVECPWLDNKPWVSCIPLGDYVLRRGVYNRRNYVTYVLEGVPGRTHCKIHKGNTMDDLRGCIAPGEQLWWSETAKKWSVYPSTGAFNGFMEAMGDVDEAMLQVRALDTALLYSQGGKRG